MRFDERLIELRKTKGYNQEQLAEKVGVSRQAVSKWETGDAQPDFSKLIALADALETDLDLLCGREVVCKNGIATPKKASKRNVKLVSIYIILALVIFVAGIFAGSLFSIDEQPPISQSTVSVSGVKFAKMAEEGKVNYQFVPSISGDDCRYTLLLQDEDGKKEEFSVTCKNGKCAGVLKLDSTKIYTATIVIHKRDTKHIVPIVKSLRLNKKEVIWD